MTSRSDFCDCANEANPGATVLKNAFVKNGALFSFLGFGTGLLGLAVFFFVEGVDLITRGAAEDLRIYGAAEDLGSCGSVEVDASFLIGDRLRRGSFALLSSSSSNAVLQKSAISQ